MEAGARVLLIHDGELEDVREMLDALEVPCQIESPSTVALGVYLAAPLVVSTPTYLLDRLHDGSSGEGRRIAVMDGESRTLRSMLTRGGVEWMVRRPVHPQALRLLLMHCLYQGPEKRKTRRVSMGAEVQLRAGWKKKPALLVDLSERDCRLNVAQPLSFGARVKLQIPKTLTGDRGISIEGKVVRNAESGDEARPAEVCLVFSDARAADEACLSALLARYARGPVQISTVAAPASASTVDLEERRSLIAIGDSGHVAGAGGSSVGSEASERDRRRDERHEFERRVIALGEQAARVLVGRDISAQAMRVDATSALELGQELRIAIHVPGHDTPLVVDVGVVRDDGDRGLLLEFRELSRTATDYLRTMIGELPSVDARSDDDDITETLFVSEIVEREAV